MRYGFGLDLEVNPAFVQPGVIGFKVVQHQKAGIDIGTSTLEHLVIRPVTSILKTVWYETRLRVDRVKPRSFL